jgi:hypothetical protein
MPLLRVWLMALTLIRGYPKARPLDSDLQQGLSSILLSNDWSVDLIFVVRFKCTKDKGAELTTVFGITNSIEINITFGSYNRVTNITTVNHFKLSG